MLIAGNFITSNVSLSVNALLVNTATRLVLIDTGTGASQIFGPNRQLLANLRASGCSAEQVEEIYVTHMHADHVGRLMHDGHAAFPKATIGADLRDAGRYVAKAEMDAAPVEEREDCQSAMAIFKPFSHRAGSAIRGRNAIDSPRACRPGCRAHVGPHN